jgi:endonuclease V-like protein UPF0215 family
MSAWPLKSQARIAGVDDTPYIRGSELTPIIITVMRIDGYIEGFLQTSISTDGSDSSGIIADTVADSRFGTQVRTILSDGACLAGFNVLDLGDLWKRTGIPEITCSDEVPNTESVIRALRGNFPDWEERLSLILRWEAKKVDLPDGPCYIRVQGMDHEKAGWLIGKITVRGRTPEPLRISHLVARAVYSDAGT